MSTDRDKVLSLVRQSGSSFYWAMRLLSRERQDAMFAIYAYCRILDDIADGEGAAEEKLALLAGWRAELAAFMAGSPTQPVTRALVEPVRRFDLDPAELLALIDGMEMDARDMMRIPDWQDLRLYCRRVAGSVGALAIPIFHRASPAGTALATALGEALQLTNILRDIKEDAAIGRLYLPRQALDSAEIEGTDIEAIIRDPRLGNACAWLAAKAAERFTEAEQLLRAMPAGPMRPARTIKEIYRRLLQRLYRRGWSTLDPPPREPSLSLLWIAARQFLPT